jgi:hypothetical protein
MILQNNECLKTHFQHSLMNILSNQDHEQDFLALISGALNDPFYSPFRKPDIKAEILQSSARNAMYNYVRLDDIFNSNLAKHFKNKGCKNVYELYMRMDEVCTRKMAGEHHRSLLIWLQFWSTYYRGPERVKKLNRLGKEIMETNEEEKRFGQCVTGGKQCIFDVQPRDNPIEFLAKASEKELDTAVEWYEMQNKWSEMHSAKWKSKESRLHPLKPSIALKNYLKKQEYLLEQVKGKEETMSWEQLLLYCLLSDILGK